MDDEEEIARSVAEFDGFSAEEALEARRILDLPHDDFAVRFTEFARFARIFGVELAALATFVTSGSGIEPYEDRTGISRDEWKRIREVQDRLASRGDWARTILALLDEAERRRTE
jgi:hypothetical protein